VFIYPASAAKHNKRMCIDDYIQHTIAKKNQKKGAFCHFRERSPISVLTRLDTE